MWNENENKFNVRVLNSSVSSSSSSLSFSQLFSVNHSCPRLQIVLILHISYAYISSPSSLLLSIVSDHLFFVFLFLLLPFPLFFITCPNNLSRFFFFFCTINNTLITSIYFSLEINIPRVLNLWPSTFMHI